MWCSNAARSATGSRSNCDDVDEPQEGAGVGTVTLVRVGDLGGFVG